MNTNKQSDLYKSPSAGMGIWNWNLTPTTTEIHFQESLNSIKYTGKLNFHHVMIAAWTISRCLKFTVFTLSSKGCLELFKSQTSPDSQQTVHALIWRILLMSLVFVLWRPLWLKMCILPKILCILSLTNHHTFFFPVFFHCVQRPFKYECCGGGDKTVYLVGVISTRLSFFHFTGAPTSGWNHSRLTMTLFYRAEAALLLCNTDTQTIMKYTQTNNLRRQQLGWFSFSINRDLHVFYRNFYAKTEMHKESNMPHTEFNLTTCL